MSIGEDDKPPSEFEQEPLERPEAESDEGNLQHQSPSSELEPGSSRGSDSALGSESARRLFGDVISSLSGGVDKYKIDFHREKLGEGGEADVYLAYDGRDRDPIALKILKPQHRDNPALVQHFRLAAERLSRLDHPNIVRVLERSGRLDDPPYVALQYVSGGSLAEHQERFSNPRDVAVLMLQVARALQHAHERGILHGDISPSNILLERGKPMLTDFVAQRVGHAHTGLRAGKLNYMCPEKAKGHGDTVTADTFSMGAVLYELLSGAPPIQAESVDDVVRSYEQTPLGVVLGFRGRSSVPYAHLLPELSALCRTALDPNPNRRYRSAQAFADNLQRILLRMPTLYPQVSLPGRCRLWLARHPFLGAAAALGAVLLVVADLAIARSTSEGERIQVADTIANNISVARLQADSTLNQFLARANAVIAAAQSERLVQFLRDPKGSRPIETLKEQVQLSDLDSLAIFDLKGRMLGRYPEPGAGLVGRDFSFRDYHKCVQSLLDNPESGPSSTCVSPVIRGESSRVMELNFATIAYSQTGEPLGYLLLGSHTRRNLEQQERQHGHPGVGQTTALLGPRGVDRTQLAEPEAQDKLARLVFVSHPALFGAEERVLGRELSDRLKQGFVLGAPGAQLDHLDAAPLADEHYLDPITLEPSVAAFAPVGKTGFVVAVSTPLEVALQPWKRHWDLLKWHIGLLNLGLVILATAAVLGARRSTLAVGNEDPLLRT